MQEYFTQIAKGLVLTTSYIYKFGRNESVGSTEVLVGSGGIYGLPDSAEPLICTSTSGDDVVGGDGARTMHVFGLDNALNPIDEIVDMGAATINSYRRVFRAHVQTAGTTTPVGGANLGTISIKQETSGVDMVKIDTGDGQTLISCFTIPAGYTGYMWQVNITTGEGKNTVARLKAREFEADSPFRVKGIRDSFENTVGNTFKIPTKYLEKADIVFTAKSTAVGTPVSGTFLLELVKNDGLI